MPPKSKFTRDQIIEAAFEIAQIEGIDSITIRKVADQLGSSIAPIYVNFQEVRELIQAVVHKTIEISKQLVLEQQSGDPFHDIGAASIRFAREYSVLYRDLIMKPNDYMGDEEDNTGLLVELMKQDPALEGFTDEELRSLLLKMKIFQTGLSVMVANGLLPEALSEEQLVEVLDHTAIDMIAATRLRKEGHIQ